MIDLKIYLPQILAILAAFAGAGTLGTVQYNADTHANDTRYTANHTANMTADLIIEIHELKKRVKQLEEK